MLIERGANVDLKDNDGHTALKLAVERRFKSCVRALVEGVRNRNAKTDIREDDLYNKGAPDMEILRRLHALKGSP